MVERLDGLVEPSGPLGPAAGPWLPGWQLVARGGSVIGARAGTMGVLWPRVAAFPGGFLETVRWFVDFFVHLDRHMAELIQTYGTWTYGILFTVVFLETGLVVTPLLPGDSLLFAAGTFASLGALSFWPLFFLLCVAAILGDTLNYAIGHYLGPKVFHYPRSRFFNPDHLRKTHAFYEKYGGKTIIIARFVPIVRTFAPFVAGIGAMSYGKFITYNIVGGVLWVSVCLSAGYFFGNLPFVKKNFSLVILAIIFISILPAVIEYLRHRAEARKAAAAPGEAAGA
jgi:membrane-associated protein